jgi:hypothetical protein
MNHVGSVEIIRNLNEVSDVFEELVVQSQRMLESSEL